MSMESQENLERKSSHQEANDPQSPSLSEAFRALFGPETGKSAGRQKPTPSQSDEPSPPGGAPGEQPTPQSTDPWAELVRIRGMESLDLQKTHLRDLFPTASNEDIEQALERMQEEKRPGQS